MIINIILIWLLLGLIGYIINAISEVLDNMLTFKDGFKLSILKIFNDYKTTIELATALIAILFGVVTLTISIWNLISVIKNR